jgi:hypothetical protein
MKEKENSACCLDKLHDNLGLMLAPTIGDLADEENHPGRLENRDLTTLNHQNYLDG